MRDPKPRKRGFPPGVAPKKLVSLHEFLPYRIHVLSSKIAMPPPVSVPGGKVVKARDWRVLLQLASNGPLTNRELSKLLGFDAATITRVVQHLTELEFVTTKASARDRRKQIISLTKAGADAHDFIAPGRMQTNELISAGLSHLERDLFIKLMDKLEDHLTELGLDSDDADWD